MEFDRNVGTRVALNCRCSANSSSVKLKTFESKDWSSTRVRTVYLNLWNAKFALQTRGIWFFKSNDSNLANDRLASVRQRFTFQFVLVQFAKLSLANCLVRFDSFCTSSFKIFCENWRAFTLGVRLVRLVLEETGNHPHSDLIGFWTPSKTKRQPTWPNLVQ